MTATLDHIRKSPTGYFSFLLAGLTQQDLGEYVPDVTMPTATTALLVAKRSDLSDNSGDSVGDDSVTYHLSLVYFCTLYIYSVL